MTADVVVVVGVGGMGEVIARRQGSGRRVLLADFNDSALQKVGASMRDDGFLVETASVDVTDAGSVEGLAQYAATLGPLKQVVHTAGVSPTTGSVERMLAVNALGVAHSLDAFGRVIADGGAGVVVASMAGSMAIGRFPSEWEEALRAVPTADLLRQRLLDADTIHDSGIAYSFAKRSNQLRVEAASLAWGARGARVNSVSPGVISTEHGQNELRGESGVAMRTMIERSAIGRIGTPYDIADAISFLLGPRASFITGTDLLVDGGVVAAMRSGALQPAR